MGTGMLRLGAGLPLNRLHPAVGSWCAPRPQDHFVQQHPAPLTCRQTPIASRQRFKATRLKQSSGRAGYPIVLTSRARAAPATSAARDSGVAVTDQEPSWGTRGHGRLPEQGWCVRCVRPTAAPCRPAGPCAHSRRLLVQAGPRREGSGGAAAAAAASPPPPLSTAPGPQEAAAAPRCDAPSCAGPSGAAVLEAPREEERLRAVHALQLIGVEPKPALDNITQLMVVRVCWSFVAGT